MGANSCVRGGDDLPCAYRSVPVCPDDLRLNVVAVRGPATGEWKFQVAWALLFGFSASVMQFARWYVDDANVTDFASARGAGQEAAQCMCAELGTPVAPSKTRQMRPSGDFLSILHTFGPLSFEQTCCKTIGSSMISHIEPSSGSSKSAP